MGFVVAVDWPAGSGKGTISELVAEKLDLIHIDTGALYRCVALYAIDNEINKDEEEKIIKNLENIKIDQRKESGKQIIMLNGKDVSSRIRTQEVNDIVSEVSSIHEVRTTILALERKLAEGKKVIMEGRDIGTVVFPNAEVKIYLDGSLDVRAQRRYKEYLETGINVNYDEVKQSIIERDQKDKAKKYGALKMADDAVRVDTTNLTIEEVVDEVINIIERSK